METLVEEEIESTWGFLFAALGTQPLAGSLAPTWCTCCRAEMITCIFSQRQGQDQLPPFTWSPLKKDAQSIVFMIWVTFYSFLFQHYICLCFAVTKFL